MVDHSSPVSGKCRKKPKMHLHASRIFQVYPEGGIALKWQGKAARSAFAWHVLIECISVVAPTSK